MALAAERTRWGGKRSRSSRRHPRPSRTRSPVRADRAGRGLRPARAPQPRGCVVRVPKLDARVGYLFVDELHVLRDHRRLGVASALIEAVWSLALEIGYHGVRLLVRKENTAARRLYARLGFTEQETGFCERARAR